MQSNTEILIPESTYHLYNRANGSEKLFRSGENYRYFLQKYQEYVWPIANTFCYCLMPNHFHFLLRIKPEKELIGHFNSLPGQSATLQGFKTLEGLSAESAARQAAISRLLNQRFSHFFNGYTQAFNKQNNRKGSLFMHPFKRKKISSTEYLKQLVHYIHHNPIEAGLCEHPENWPQSSYNMLLSHEHTFLNREEVILWFEDKTNFIHFHRNICSITTA